VLAFKKYEQQAVDGNTKTLEVFISGDTAIGIQHLVNNQPSHRPMALDLLWKVRCAAGAHHHHHHHHHLSGSLLRGAAYGARAARAQLPPPPLPPPRCPAAARGSAARSVPRPRHPRACLPAAGA
jgi:hypothetical protein